jgi:hypothetical protein
MNKYQESDMKDQLQEQEMNNHQIEDDTVEFEVETDNLVESLLRNVVKGYETAFNKQNDKNEIKFTCTITNHKVQTADGNKACAYLRLDRSVKPKGPGKIIQEEGKPDIIDEGWETKLLHQEVYFFKGIKEQINPKAPWKDQLYLNCLARLISAGLEYAELLQRLQRIKAGEETVEPARPRTEQEQTEERLNSIGLTTSTEMPKPLSEDEAKYKMWVEKNTEYGK